MEKRPLEPEDIQNFISVGEPQISPDGKALSYVRQRVDKDKEKYLTDIFLMDLDSKMSRQLTNSGKDKHPRWSPDGKKLAFISERSGKSQIWVIDTEGGEAWQIPTKEKVESEPLWSSDGTRIFYVSKAFSKPSDWEPYPGCPQDDRDRAVDQAKRTLEEKSEDNSKRNQEDKKPNDVKVITRLRYRMDGSGYFGDLVRQVFYVQALNSPSVTQDQKGTQMTTLDFDHGLPSLSPLGDFALVTSLHIKDADYLLKNDIWLFHIETGKHWLLYDAPGPVLGVKWSSDEKWISFFGHNNRKSVSTRTDLYLLNVESFVTQARKSMKEGDGSYQELTPLCEKDAVNLTGHLDRQAGGLIGSDIHFGASSSSKWVGNTLYFALEDHGSAYVYRAEILGGKWLLEKVYGSPLEAISGFDVSDSRLVIQASTPKTPENLYLVDLRNMSREQLTFANDEFMANIRLGDFEKFTYKARDGQELDGWLIYPYDFQPGKKYPLVVTIHGGPHGAYGSAFLFAAEIFAGRGYAVAYFNPRGSTSYGQEFMSCIDGDWGHTDYEDIMDGVHAVISRGFVDKDKLFVFGWSYGGYMTAWIVTQTKEFRAACSGAPVTDLLSDYGTSDILWADEHEYGAKPWENPDLLLSRSPLSHVANVTTPILMLHGENDLRCPIIQSEEFYVALKRLRKTAVFVRYPGEFHGLARILHRIDRFKRMLAWFEYYRRN